MTMTTSKGNGAMPVHESVRVSLREIRESGFRALSAAGASHGEAWTAARMVLDAELQGGLGIEVLLADLERGRWPQDGVDLVETEAEPLPVTRLGTAQSNRLLRHGPLAVIVATAEPGSGGVFVPGALPGLSCLEAVLLEAALGQQQAVGVLRTGAGRDGAYRVALSDGSLGSGRTDAGGPDITQEGLWVVAPSPQALLDGPHLTWVSAQERADRRAEAARNGCLVEATAWRRLYAESRRYLVD